MKLKKSLFFLITAINLFSVRAETEAPNASPLSETTPCLSLFIDLSASDRINLELLWNNKIKLTGGYLPSSNELNVTALLNDINLTDFNPQFRNFPLKTGYLKKGILNFKTNKNYSLSGNLEIEKLSFIQYAKAFPFQEDKQTMEFKGNLNLSGQITFSNLSSNFLKDASYSLDAALSEGEIQKIPLINNLSQITAEITLTQEKLNLVKLEAVFPQTATKTNRLFLKGEISDLNDLAFSFQADTAMPFNQFIQTINKIKNLPFEYTEEGNVDLKCAGAGNLKQKDFTYTVNYEITGADYKDFHNIHAKGSLTADKVILENSRINYKKIPWELKGTLENFNHPKIALTLTNDLLNISAKASSNQENIDIEELTLKSDNTNIISKGYITTAPGLLKIEGFGNIGLENIKKITEALDLKTGLLTALNPQGQFDGKFQMEGGIDINDWQIKLAGVSKNIQIYGIAVQDLTVEFYKDKNELIVSPLTAKLGQGDIQLRGKLDYLNDSSTLDLTAANIDLGNIRDQINLKNKTLAGKLSVQALITNKSTSKWNSLDGEGKIVIRDGNLWQINLLQGIAQFLFLPDFDKITFKEASSDLTFKGEDVLFTNLDLTSTQLSLKGQGSISLNGGIKFQLSPEISPDLISSSGNLQAMLSEYLGKSGFAVSIEGTLKNPKYKISSVFLSPVEGITNLLTEILK